MVSHHHRPCPNGGTGAEQHGGAFPGLAGDAESGLCGDHGGAGDRLSADRALLPVHPALKNHG